MSIETDLFGQEWEWESVIAALKTALEIEDDNDWDLIDHVVAELEDDDDDGPADAPDDGDDDSQEQE